MPSWPPHPDRYGIPGTWVLRSSYCSADSRSRCPTHARKRYRGCRNLGMCSCLDPRILNSADTLLSTVSCMAFLLIPPVLRPWRGTPCMGTRCAQTMPRKGRLTGICRALNRRTPCPKASACAAKWAAWKVSREHPTRSPLAHINVQDAPRYPLGGGGRRAGPSGGRRISSPSSAAGDP
jgi:hypothetical protein